MGICREFGNPRELHRGTATLIEIRGRSIFPLIYLKVSQCQNRSFSRRMGKVVSFEIDRATGQKVGKSLLGSGTVDFAARNLHGFRVTLTTTPRESDQERKVSGEH